MLRKIEILCKVAFIGSKSRLLNKYGDSQALILFKKFALYSKKCLGDVEKTISLGHEIVILENKVISPTIWSGKSSHEQSSRTQNIVKYSSYTEDKKNVRFQTPSGERDKPYRITVISSIYRPGEYFDSFLGNLTEQTIFFDTEFVLVLVDPTEDELIIATSFALTFPNVRLETEKTRISIYEAWNRAILLASSTFITNMNVDDVRSSDSLEKQVSFMENHTWADVGYADFYYLLDKRLDWTSISNIGAKSDVPLASLIGMAWFGINSPHNGPIWRRDLHDRFGMFESKLKSAGDYEFWMRAISQGACFLKMKETTVGYFLNPNGMSTNSNSPSTGEEVELQNQYRSLMELKIGAFRSIYKIPLPSEIEKFPWKYADVVTEDVLNYLGGN